MQSIFWQIHQDLKRGGAVWVLPDAKVMRPSAKTLTVRIGKKH